MASSLVHFVQMLLGAPLLQPLTHWAYQRRSAGGLHPFDRRHGIDAGGHLPAWLLRSRQGANDQTAYLGCIPSALTAALRAIPDLDGATFVDLGCGKGRALAVAQGFPFAAIRGVELNARLVTIARANAEVLRQRDPSAVGIEVRQGDARAPEPVAGDVVYFLYHPFGRATTERLCAHLAAQSEKAGWRMFVVYENPVHGEVFDAEPRFTRWYAATLPYELEEVGFGPDASESVAIWANRAAGPTPHKADGAIVVSKPDWRAEIVAV